MSIDKILPSSFRDPSGQLFYRDSILYRKVNLSYKEHYDYFIGSGLYQKLADSNLLIPHQECSLEAADSDRTYKTLKPQRLPFISYPYEWCFSQLKEAALLTLRIQKKALDYGMCLKDCSAYNVQFIGFKPIFIDTLSFEKYYQGRPWLAYRQFCQQFLAPLALASYRDIRLGQLSRIYVDGIPLDLASKLLPSRTRVVFSLASHIHLHAETQKYFAGRKLNKRYRLSKHSFYSFIDHLESTVRRLSLKQRHTEWTDYYRDTNYSQEAFLSKKQLIAEYLDEANPESVWDLGANIGVFSRIASNKNIMTISFDNDAAVVESNYLECIKKNELNILPLVMDLINPSSGVGWQGEERMSLFERGPVDTVLALALIHHLAISSNLPMDRIVSFFKVICKKIIIEFIPKSDSQVQRLLASREDIFDNYNQKCFEYEFSKHFTIRRSANIRNSQRVVYFMERRENMA